VIAEIQQRSDATFRMFDFGRKRELHIARAIAVADAGPADVGLKPKRLTDERTLLVCNPYFAFERIDLAPGSALRLGAERETWLLVVSGNGRAGPFNAVTGDAVFARADSVDIQAGSNGMTFLAASTNIGASVPDLRHNLAQPSAADPAPVVEKQVPTLDRTSAAQLLGHEGTIQ
jgi:mannose-6-phosphate isomerase